MRILVLIWALLSLVGQSSVLARQAVEIPEFRVRQEGGPFPDGTRVAVVQRRGGQRTRFRVSTFKDGWLKFQGLPLDDKGQAYTCFLIVGLTKLERFDDFLEHPEDWTWASIPSEIGKDFYGSVEYFWKGQKVLVRGRVVAPGKKPIDHLDVDCWREDKDRAGRKIERGTRVGYDPISGRFWVLKIRGRGPDAEAYSLDLIPFRSHVPKKPALARMLRVPWPRGEEKLIQVPRASRVQGKVLGPGDPSVPPRFSATLVLEGVGLVEQLGIPGPLPFAFEGLSEGRYDLCIRAEGSKIPLYEKKGLVLEKAQRLELPDIDLRDQLKVVQISIVDAQGTPLDATVRFVQSEGNPGDISRIHWGSTVYIRAKAGLLFPRSGLPIVVSASGMGTRIFKNVKRNLEVVMSEPTRLQLRLVGLDKHPDLLKDLRLLAQPTADYPIWAWKALVPELGWSERSLRQERPESASKEPPVLLSVARMASKEARLMDIPYPGNWRFDLAYMRNQKTLRIPLPELDSVDIKSPQQDLTIQIPPAILRAARKKFEALLRRR